jgi:biotin carboxyl carrier protein
MRYSVTIAGQPHTLDVAAADHGQARILLDNAPIALDRAQLGRDRVSLLIDGHSYDLFLRPVASDADDTLAYEVVMDGLPRVVELVDERKRALAGMGRGRGESGEATVKAPMPGLVANILVAAGDAVEHGQPVVILEAMKMQNALNAPRAGVIRAVKAEKGQAVNQGQPLVVIGDPEGSQPPVEEDE